MPRSPSRPPKSRVPGPPVADPGAPQNEPKPRDDGKASSDAGAVKLKDGSRPGSEVYEINYDSEPPSAAPVTAAVAPKPTATSPRAYGERDQSSTDPAKITKRDGPLNREGPLHAKTPAYAQPIDPRAMSGVGDDGGRTLPAADHSIPDEAVPPSRLKTMPAARHIPSRKTTDPHLPHLPRNADPQPPTKKTIPALQRTVTRRLGEDEPNQSPESDPSRGDAKKSFGLRSTALGLGVPGPSFGGDTELDPMPRPMGQPPVTRPNPQGADAFDLGLELGTTGENDALDLVGRDDAEAGSRHTAVQGSSVGVAQGSSIMPEGPSTPPDPLGELRERYALGDFSGALVIAEGILSSEPGNADAQRYAESCRDVLKQMYAARLGPLDQVPSVAVPLEQLRWLTLDHRAGFLLSHVDGVSTLEEILDISGMPHLEAMRIIHDLVQQKVVVLQ